MTVLNTINYDLSSEPLFFGKQLGLGRYDIKKYAIFEKLNDLQKSLYWNPLEIGLQKDISDFKNLQPHEKSIFTKNISYQILLDSVQGRAPIYAFLPWVSQPELESCIVTWCFFEMIHEKSYQWILQNLYPNPSKVFDDILLNDVILNRATSVTKYYDDFITLAESFKLNNSSDKKTLKEKLYLALIAVYALEGIRFQISFSVSIAFAKLGHMIGNGSIIKLIAKDEAQHVAIVANILKILKTEDSDFVDIAKKLESDVYQIFDDVVRQEKDWAKYLFQDGVIVGLNEQILSSYVEYNANKRLKTIGLKGIYSTNQDPLPWINTYINGEEVQVAPQETEITDYRINILDTQLNEAEIMDI